MVFTSSIIAKYVFGNKRVHVGSWDSTAVASGDIDTGLKRVEICEIWHKGTAVEIASAVVNETFPLASGDVTIVTASGDAGYWEAKGR